MRPTFLSIAFARTYAPVSSYSTDHVPRLSSVEQGFVFNLETPSHVSIPQKSEWHDGQRRLVIGKVYKRSVMSYMHGLIESDIL